MEKLRIVFMGTPDFAVGILKRVLDEGYDVAAVVTAVDKPAGRGQKIKFSAVKEFADGRGIKILQPANMKDPAFHEELRSLNANLHIVVAFRMLPEAVWKMPKLGTFNLHASLLPQYRGAAPINWAIINGEKTTGVTTFFIDDKIDTGEIITSSELEIRDDETAGELHDRLMLAGADTVIDTLKLIEKSEVQTRRQPDHAEKTAFKLNRENCMINWTKTAASVHNHIRGLSPYPAAWTTFKNAEEEFNVKIYRSALRETSDAVIPGQITSDKKEILIDCGMGRVSIIELQLPGKKKMSAAELLNGFKFDENAVAF